MPANLSRREMMACAGACLARQRCWTLAASRAEPVPTTPKEPFTYSLNMGTMIGFKLPLVEEFEIAAKAGYRSIEPWLITSAATSSRAGRWPKRKSGSRTLA